MQAMGKSVGEKETHAQPIVLLSDDPIESSMDDKFSHETFVNKLVSLFESNQKHFNIGLFGKWGTGKTGILNLLQQKIAGDKFDFIYMDSWKLSKDSLRQQLLFQISRKYKPKTGEEEIADQLFNVKVEPLKIGKETKEETITRLLEISIPYLIFAAIFITIGIIADLWLPNRNLAPIVSSVFAVPLILKLAKELAKNSKTLTKTGKKIIPRIESPVQFAKIFDDLIKKRKKGKKTIIAIDNLDRCESELVIEMLSTIKTFMETDGVFFIVACDDNALVEHLKGKRSFTCETSKEFLRKFFQISITIPPIIEGDLLKYIDGLTENLTVPITEGVKEVLLVATIDNPRRIKQFLNNYVVTFHLAMERENIGIIGKGALTDHLGFLAKIMVIREVFPKFYDELLRRDDLLYQIEKNFRDEITETNEKEKLDLILDQNQGLEWFLQRTRPIEVSDISPFIKLAQETYESLLPKQEELKVKVRLNDFNYIKKILKNMSDNDKSNVVRLIFKILRNDISRKRNTFVFNELNVLLEIKDDVPENITNELVHQFEQSCSTKLVCSDLARFDPPKLFSILPIMQPTYRDSILDKYILLVIQNDQVNEQTFDLVLSNHNILSQKAKILLSRLLIELNERNEMLYRSLIRKIISDYNGQNLITQELIQAGIKKISSGQVEQNSYRIGLYLEIKNLASSATKHLFIEKLLTVISVSKSAPDAETELVLETLTNLKEDDVPLSIIDSFAKETESIIKAMRNITHKIEVLRPFIPHMHNMANDTREHFFEEVLKPILTSGPPDEISKLTVDFSQAKLNILADDSLLQILIQRSKNNIFDLKLMEYLLQKTPKEKISDVVELIVVNISSRTSPKYTIALNSIANNHKLLSKKDVDTVCSSIITTSKNVAPNDLPKFYNTLTSIYQSCSKNTQDEIAFELLDLMKKPQPLQTIGIDYFNKMKNMIRKQKRNYIIRQLVISLAGEPKPRNVPILDLIIENQDLMGKNDRIRLIDYLSGYVSPAQNQEVQITSLKYVEKLSNLYSRREELLNTTLLIAKNANPDLKKMCLLVIQKFGKNVKEKDFWEEAENVFGENIREK